MIKSLYFYSLRLCRLCAYSALISALSLFASGATAQAQDEGEELEEVTVTGSRIKRQDFTANSPIVTIDTNTFENTSTIGLETILNQLPQFVPGVTGAAISGALEFNTGGSQFSSGGIEANAFQTPGASRVNLRGLGAGRNLVLIDGRRGMPLNSTMTVDINSIPSSAVERIEIISGGASAVYGADAVAGALNFILKDDFEGLAINTNWGITEQGDAQEYRVSGLFGTSTADGRGNVMVGLEHSRRRAGDLNDRDWYLEDRSDPAVGGTDFFYSDTYIGVNFFDPTWFLKLPSQAAIDSVFPTATPGSVGTFSNFYVNRTPDGTGTVYTGPVVFGGAERDGAYKYNGVLDVNGFPFRKLDPAGGIAQNQLVNPIAVPLERYSLFAKANYDVTENISVFGNVTFARTLTTTSSQFSPAVPGWAVAIPVGTGIYTNSFDNPTLRSFFNPTGAITGYNAATGAPIFDPAAPTNPAYITGGAFGLNCAATGGCTNSQVFPMPAEVQTLLASRGFFGSAANEPVTVGRVLDFLGERTTKNTTSNYQFVAGLEGEFANGWTWDTSISHGESEAQSQLNNFGSVERYRAIARSPNYGRAFTATGNTAGGGFGGGVATCESGLPLFREFEISEDCINAIATTLSQNGLMEQETAEVNLAGDLYKLPEGQLQFALGATYRRNEYSFKTTDNNRDVNFVDLVMGLFPAGDTVGEIDVREIYGELLVPLVSDGPNGIRELNLELGGRYSDYNTSGGVDTVKALADWLSLDWMRFRGGYQKATRAPNIQELFTGRTLSIFSAGSSHGDVCSQNNFSSVLSVATGVQAGSGLPAPATAAQVAQTQAICNAMMGNARAAYYSNAIADQPNPGGGGAVWITGNPAVDPETAETFTAGLVVTSPLDNPWLRGLTGSMDWFQIEVDGVISTQSATLVNERCFSVVLNPTGDPNNVWCQLIARNPATGESLSTDLTYTNESHVKLSGIDLQLNWNAQLADLGLDFIPGGMGMNILTTIPLKIETNASANSATIDWVGFQSGGECPSGISCTGYEYQIFGTFNYFNGPFSASLRWQHYPSIDSGALAANPLSTAIGVHDAYNVFALSGSYQINDTFLVRAGVENLLDTEPPLFGGNPTATPFAAPATHTTGGFYDPYGRRFFVGVDMNF